MVQVARNMFRSDASLPELANMLVSARTDYRFAGWCDILDDDGEIAGQDHCGRLAAELNLDIFQAAEVADFGRRELAEWARVVDFSKSRFR